MPLESFLLFPQAVDNVWSNPGFGVGIFVEEFNWDGCGNAEFDVVCDLHPLIQTATRENVQASEP